MNAFVGFKNKKGFRLLGLISFHSDSRTLTVRDEHIGWTTAQNKKHRERIVNMNTCVPTQPFGFNFLGESSWLWFQLNWLKNGIRNTKQL